MCNPITPQLSLSKSLLWLKKKFPWTHVTRLNLLDVYPYITKFYKRVDTRLSLLLTHIRHIWNLAATKNGALFGSIPRLTIKFPPTSIKLFFTSYKHRSICKATELSKFVWKCKDAGLTSSIHLEIGLSRIFIQTRKWLLQPLPGGKFAILPADPKTTLKQKTELMNKCRHRNNFKLKNPNLDYLHCLRTLFLPLAFLPCIQLYINVTAALYI